MDENLALGISNTITAGGGVIQQALAIGFDCEATQSNAAAIGVQCTASGVNYSLAMGSFNQAAGAGSTAMGGSVSTDSNSNYAAALGQALSLVNQSDQCIVGTGPSASIGGAGAYSAWTFYDSITGNIFLVPDAGSHKVVIFPNSTVAQLPAAAAAYKGARTFVSDSTVAALANFGNAVIGLGANFVPVYCDGAAWRIG